MVPEPAAPQAYHLGLALFQQHTGSDVRLSCGNAALQSTQLCADEMCDSLPLVHLSLAVSPPPAARRRLPKSFAPICRPGVEPP